MVCHTHFGGSPDSRRARTRTSQLLVGIAEPIKHEPMSVKHGLRNSSTLALTAKRGRTPWSPHCLQSWQP